MDNGQRAMTNGYRITVMVGSQQMADSGWRIVAGVGWDGMIDDERKDD